MAEPTKMALSLMKSCVKQLLTAKQAVAESLPQAPQNQTNPAQPAMNPDGTPVQPGQQPAQGTTEVASSVKVDVTPMRLELTGKIESDSQIIASQINKYFAEIGASGDNRSIHEGFTRKG